MRFFSTLCFSLFTILLVASPSAAQRGRDVEKFDKTDSTQGLVIYSISTTKPAFSGYYLDIFHLESRKKEKLRLQSFQLPEIKNDSSRVYYHAVMLPSGDYKIYGWGMEYNYGSGEKTFFPMGNFGLPFTVFGGSINYLGDYLGTTTLGKSIIGLKVANGGYFIVSNRAVY